jgi:hypothetical protein
MGEHTAWGESFRQGLQEFVARFLRDLMTLRRENEICGTVIDVLDRLFFNEEDTHSRFFLVGPLKRRI